MKIGIISDTHDDFEMTRKAVEIFKQIGVELVIHAGDLTSPEMLVLFKDLNCKFVFGNSDDNIDLINRESLKLEFGCIEDRCDFKIGHLRFLVIHGDKVEIFREAVTSGEYNYIIKGHTHYYENYVSNETRIINPGSIHENPEHIIVILDTASDEVRKVYI